MSSLYKNLVFWAVIIIVMVLLFHLFSRPRQTASERNYSEFISAVDNNRVEEVETLGRNLTWKNKEGKRFKTYAPEDPEMIKILREKAWSSMHRKKATRLSCKSSSTGLPCSSSWVSGSSSCGKCRLGAGRLFPLERAKLRF